MAAKTRPARIAENEQEPEQGRQQCASRGPLSTSCRSAAAQGAGQPVAPNRYGKPGGVAPAQTPEPAPDSAGSPVLGLAPMNEMGRVGALAEAGERALDRVSQDGFGADRRIRALLGVRSIVLVG